MTSNDLGTQKLHRALFAAFLYATSSDFDSRIHHQLLTNADAVQASYGISDVQFYALADQAHAEAQAETKAK
jgi:hypothetical protein